MHPALRQYVGRPAPGTARYLAIGALTGFAGVALAFAIVRVVETRRTNDRQAEIERRHTLGTLPARATSPPRATSSRDCAAHAWPSWVVANPDRTCPRAISELAPFTGMATEVDPWGHAFHFTCDGARFSAASDGPDGIRATRDDIWSRR